MSWNFSNGSGGNIAPAKPREALPSTPSGAQSVFQPPLAGRPTPLMPALAVAVLLLSALFAYYFTLPFLLSKISSALDLFEGPFAENYNASLGQEFEPVSYNAPGNSSPDASNGQRSGGSILEFEQVLPDENPLEGFGNRSTLNRSGISLTLATAKQSYLQGEPVKIRVLVKPLPGAAVTYKRHYACTPSAEAYVNDEFSSLGIIPVQEDECNAAYGWVPEEQRRQLPVDGVFSDFVFDPLDERLSRVNFSKTGTFTAWGSFYDFEATGPDGVALSKTFIEQADLTFEIK